MIRPAENPVEVGPKATAEAARFLQTLFGDAVGAEALIAIWSLSDKRARFFPDAKEASTYALSRAQECDVYTGCGLYRRGVPTGHRGKASDVVGVTALWADIDYGTEHTGKNLPPDAGAAQAILGRLGVPPSIFVRSGHGLHTWWLLTEFIGIEDGAARLARRWGATIAAHAQSLGYTVDSVWDLARVLRIPGTINHKGDPVPMSIVEGYTDITRRYDPCDLEEFMFGASVDLPCATVEVANLVLDPSAVFPKKKLALLLAVDLRFQRTWEKNRTDFVDHSPSAYDFSLANFGVLAGLPDQEIANLIIAFRRKHGHDVIKCLRGDYLSGRIAKVRALRETTLPSGTRVVFKRLPRKAAHQ